MWLSNNPVNNIDDYQYIVDSVTQLIQSISSTNKECLRFDSKRITKNNMVTNSLLSNDLQFNEPCPSNSLLKSNLVLDFFHILQNSKAPYGHKQGKSLLKKKGLMDPGTFKLVIEYQKEYSLPLPDFTPDKVRFGQKNYGSIFGPKSKPLEEKETLSKVHLGEKGTIGKKARIDFLDKIHELNTPML